MSSRRMKKTTVDLPDPLYRCARELAAAENTPLADFLAALVRRALAGAEQIAADDEEKFRDWRGELL